jgi:opacity protein-like surface antigen
MRVVVFFLLAALGFVGGAAAADLDDSVIRGSDVYQPEVPVYARWSGFYAGGQLGYATSHMDFTNTTGPLITNTLRGLTLETTSVPTTPVLGAEDTHSNSYGAFFGYNSQWDAIVLGVELNYNRTSLQASQSASVFFVLQSGDGNVFNTTVTGSALSHITDVGTLRGRVGYVIGNFLPYATFGLAAGRADINESTTVTFVCATVVMPSCPRVGGRILLPPQPNTLILSKWLYGYSAGLGLDAAILPNVFLRGEWEFVQFGPFSGVHANLNALRVGAGVRF